MQKRLILGSSSPYRKMLLERLNLAFDCISPDIDETPLPHESPVELIKRLAQEKAQAIVSKANPDNSIIITSDQVACFDGQILGKPLTEEKAIEQLTLFSAEKVDFFTSLYVYDTQSQASRIMTSKYSVYFRALSQEEIRGYIKLEAPLQCAGSFKCEGLGVTLFDKMEGDDPNSLIGLPLIKLSQSLREFGVNPLLEPTTP